jgi:hypothetical protein
LRLERRYRKKRWVFPIRQQYPRPLDPARRFGSRLRYRSQLRGYDGSKLASQGKTVVVAMEDRLNVIGFLAHPAHRQLLTKSLFHHNLVRLEAV